MGIGVSNPLCCLSVNCICTWILALGSISGGRQLRQTPSPELVFSPHIYCSPLYRLCVYCYELPPPPPTRTETGPCLPLHPPHLVQGLAHIRSSDLCGIDSLIFLFLTFSIFVKLVELGPLAPKSDVTSQTILSSPLTGLCPSCGPLWQGVCPES